MNRFMCALVAIICCCCLSAAQVTAPHTQNASTSGKQQASNRKTSKPFIDRSFIETLRTDIGAADEPGIRIFLRLRCAKFLWSKELGSDANQLIEEGAAELASSSDRIPDVHVKYLRDQLLGILRSNDPDLLKIISDKYFGKTESDDTKEKPKRPGPLDSVITTGDLTSDLQNFQKALIGGYDTQQVYWFLSDVEKERPDTLPAFLEVFISTPALPKGMSVINALANLQSMYLKAQNPAGLKRLFILAVMRATEMSHTWQDQEDIRYGYGLIGNMISLMEELTPALYPEAATRLSTLRSRLPQSLVNRMAAERRVREGADSFSQLILESGSKENESFKQDLLRNAAQIALGKKQFQAALDLAKDIEREGSIGVWRDQFLEDLIGRVLEQKNLEIANSACEIIAAPLVRASGYRRIALFLAGSNDLAGARSSINSAIKLASSAEDNMAKVISLFELAKACEKVDELRVTELVGEAVKAINRLPNLTPDLKALDAEKEKDRDARIRTLVALAHHVIPAFQRLGEKDLPSALFLSKGFQTPDLRTCAIVATRMGMLSMMTVGESSN